MTPAMKKARLSAARRDQQFTNVPLGRGQCALRAAEVAVFPVRYALDESPLDRHDPQGPHPLPKGWTHALPPLETRSYTLRQVRDGWLYVWNSVDETFHEYSVSGENFTRHPWTEAQLNQDVRENPGETRPYLLYPRRSQLRIAFSPVQWTWRLCEVMRSNLTQQQRWMRHVDLPAYCASGTLEHGAPITQLGQSVADILVCDEPEDNAPTFDSTLLPTRVNEAGDACKPAFEEPLVRGLVPEQDTALLVALDDPLALIDDLAMNLMGRYLERNLFEAEHGERLDSARTVHDLCGIDIEALMLKSIADEERRQACIDDLYTLIQTDDSLRQGKALLTAQHAMIMSPLDTVTLMAAEASFKEKWGHLPDPALRRQALEHWEERRQWRADVHFDEVRQYLSRTVPLDLRLKRHCQRSESDLLMWLERLDPSAETVFHDTCNAQQATRLLDSAQGLYTLLSNGERGQDWLCRQAEQPDSLFGLSMFNFNAELAAMVRQVANTFSRTGKLDEQGRQGDGSSPAMSLSAGDITNAATRTNELKGVLDLDQVRNSALYRTLSDTARSTLGTLFKVANSQASGAWHSLSHSLLPAFRKETGLVYSTLLVLISREFASETGLVTNAHYAREFDHWQQQVNELTRRMHGEIRVLQHPAPPQEHRAARLSLRNYEAQLKELFLQRPNQITFRASGHHRLNIDMTLIQHLAADLGHAEALTQHRLLGTPAHTNRLGHWINLNLGNALPALLVGLNMWNLHSSANKAYNDGHFTADEWRIVSANAAWTGNAIAALWVGPAWNRAGTMTGQLGESTLKLAKTGYLQWLKEARSGSAASAQADRFAKASKGLLIRTATWAALGALASGLEAWQTEKEANNATSTEEKKLLETKKRLLIGMSGLSSAQLISATLGIRFGYAWVMSTPVFVIVLMLGIAYLLISVIANTYKREGLRLWLYRCTWGRSADPAWQGEEGYPRQIKALLETLQRPTVLGKALYTGGGSTPRRHLGFWLQIQIPTLLAGKQLTLQPALVETTRYGNQLRNVPWGFYGQLLNGQWIDPDQLGVMPDRIGEHTRQSDFVYTNAHPYRLWQVWIETSVTDPILELEIRYSSDLVPNEKQSTYMFRLLMKSPATEADRMNKVFSGETRDGEDLVLSHQTTQLLLLDVPDTTMSKSKNA